MNRPAFQFGDRVRYWDLVSLHTVFTEEGIFAGYGRLLNEGTAFQCRVAFYRTDAGRVETCCAGDLELIEGRGQP